jgi:hypothetical protein
MGLLAQIQYANTSTSYPDQFGGEIDSADVYIFLYDSATGLPANGNNAVVTYIMNDGGISSSYTVTIPGQSIRIYSGVINQSNYSEDGVQVSANNISFSLPPNPITGGAVSPPVAAVCDLKINFISVDIPESSPGANDAQITIQATSSYGPIQYSNNLGQSFQSSQVFSGLSGGLQQPIVKDANNCTAQGFVTVPVLTNVLVADPSVALPGGNLSRWNAAFNPIVFTYQRKDYEVTAVYNDAGADKIRVAVNAALTNTGGYQVSAGNLIYLNAGPYVGVFTVDTVYDTGSLIIDAPFTTTATGFVNINSLRPYYKILTKITHRDTLTGQQQTIQSVNRPDSTGLVKADISNFLQSLLTTADGSSYTQTCYPDLNLSAAYTVQYAQSWDNADGTPNTSAYSVITNPYHVVYAAKQLGERYGGNLAAYVPFPAVTDPSQLAKWVTDFATPAYSNGYPFDIGFLYDESLIGLTLACQVNVLDINKNALVGGTQTLYLINENGSFLLNEDGSKFVTDEQTSADIAVSGQPGLNRLLINYNFPPDAYYFTIALAYASGNTTHTLTQTQVIRIDDAVDEQSVYLRWIGLSGSWNYYRFVYNQEVSLDVQNATIIKKFVTDWENQDSIEEVISKEAGQKMKVMAEDLSVGDIKGLQSIKYSPKVQMLVNSNPVKWQTIVINTATFAEYETLNGQAPFSVTFNMPSINIQTQ